MIVKSFAKINLALKITGNREDGYHYLEMVNLPVDLHDTIEISRLPNSYDSYVITDDPDLQQIDENLCHKALEAMREHYGFKENFDIRIQKNIPFAAGLGGGSSNAAAVMLAINWMLKLNAKPDDLAEIALKLGSDVPFFLAPRPAYLTGIGEDIHPIRIKKSYFCVIVKPNTGLSTKEVYQKCDTFPRQNIDIQNVVKGLEEGDEELIINSMGNDLMPAAVSMLPEVEKIHQMLLADGFKIASMTGSGSTCFAISTDSRKCKEAAHKYEKLGYNTRFCRVFSK